MREKVVWGSGVIFRIRAIFKAKWRNFDLTRLVGCEIKPSILIAKLKSLKNETSKEMQKTKL